AVREAIDTPAIACKNDGLISNPRMRRRDMRTEDLLGTWRLIGYHNRNAVGVELAPSFGTHVIGVMHFDANGRMIVALADGRAEPPANGARRQFSAYTGTWIFKGDSVDVEVDESAWAHFVGTVQVRGVRFSNGR